jgi:hypothetical protein
MDEGKDRVKGPSPEEKEGDVERSRTRLEGLVTELDRRRHELTNVRLQLHKHRWLFLAVAGGLAAAATGATLLSVRAHRRHASWRGRLGRLREVVARVLADPGRIERANPPVVKKVVAAVAAAAASKIARGLAEKAIRRVLARPRA